MPDHSPLVFGQTQPDCVQQWLDANPAGDGQYLVAARAALEFTTTAPDSAEGYQAIIRAVEAIGIWLGNRIMPGEHSFWTMDEALRRRFPDYAWPVIATLEDLLAEAREGVQQTDRARGPGVVASALGRCAHETAAQLCDLLEVLQDPKPVPLPSEDEPSAAEDGPEAEDAPGR